MTTLRATPIFRDRKFYVPRFELFLGNQPERGSLLYDVMQVTYTDDIEKIDTFELTINNWDAEKRTFKHHDSSRLDPGNRVMLRMGYLDDRGELTMMVRGTITGMSPVFPAAGQPVLKVSGQNVLNEFCKSPRSASYAKSTASMVAAKICNDLGVVFINATDHRSHEVAHDHIIQDNQLDSVFFMSLARQEGYDITVVEGKPGEQTTLQFVRPAAAARVVYELRYGATLTEFTPTLDTAKQVSSVAVNGWDPVQGTPIKVEVSQGQLESEDRLETRLRPGMKNPVEKHREVLANQPVRDTQTAQALGRATLARINRDVVTGAGSVVGIPELRAGSHVYLWGLGQRFSGRYFVTSTTHTIGAAGYTTQFNCRLEGLEQDDHPGGAS